VRAAFVIVLIFCLVLLASLTAAHLYGAFFVVACTPDDGAPFCQQPFVCEIAAVAVLLAVAVMPDAARNAASDYAAAQSAAVRHICWAIDCLEAAGGEALCGPLHQPLGVLSDAPPTDADQAQLASVHREAAAYAAARGISISVERLNPFECCVLDTVGDAADLVRAAGASNCGPLYDTFHANIDEMDPVGVFAPNLRFIYHAHFCENDRARQEKFICPGRRRCARSSTAATAVGARSRRSDLRCRAWRRRPGSGATSFPIAKGSTATFMTFCATKGPTPERVDVRREYGT